MESIGKQIGKVDQNLKITNDNGDIVQLKLTFDFNNASDSEIKGWVVSNRAIAWQRPARAMDLNELNECNGMTITATDGGKKVKTKAERIKEAKATIEALKANYPDEYANLVSEMDIDESELTE